MKQKSTDIFSDFERIRERMEQAWQQVLGPPGAPRFSASLLDVAVDVYETDTEVVVVAELAGMSEEEIEITVDGRVMVLRGERKPPSGRPNRLYSQMEICHGPFQREILLPADVDPEQAKADYAGGMLEIALPKVARRKSRALKFVVR